MPEARVADVDLSLRLPPGNWNGFFPPAKEKAKGFLDFYYEKTPLEFHNPTFDKNQKKSPCAIKSIMMAVRYLVYTHL
jgi:hypothetical protein